MKKFKFLSIVVALLSVMAIIGCANPSGGDGSSSGGSISSASLVGTWKNAELNLSITVNSDGKSGTMPALTGDGEVPFTIETNKIKANGQVIGTIKKVTDTKMTVNITGVNGNNDFELTKETPKPDTKPDSETKPGDGGNTPDPKPENPNNEGLIGNWVSNGDSFYVVLETTDSGKIIFLDGTVLPFVIKNGYVMVYDSRFGKFSNTKDGFTIERNEEPSLFKFTKYEGALPSPNPELDPTVCEGTWVSENKPIITIVVESGAKSGTITGMGTETINFIVDGRNIVEVKQNVKSFFGTILDINEKSMKFSQGGKTKMFKKKLVK